ncbi:MAG: hypothetical protein A3I66_05430 [Burkholderiales bacterium RIFCSPLOWO2_02_FULL_57_36]|nr:MAG: hypothetical protein A3I66_05430 [Burkholderiales bacterium RIFCSPLOWO2_02_FULL_57_36]
MKIRLNRLVVLACAMPAMSLAHAQEKLLVQVPAVYDAQAMVGRKIREECALENLLGNHVYERVSQNFPGSLQIKDPGAAGSDKVLHLTILSVRGVGGGAWSGPKSMTMRADLVQNGKVLQTTIKKRSSTGGAFGAYLGTCSILERDAQALGVDVAQWLSRAALAGSEPVPQAAAEPDADEKKAD